MTLPKIIVASSNNAMARACFAAAEAPAVQFRMGGSPCPTAAAAVLSGNRGSTPQSSSRGLRGSAPFSRTLAHPTARSIRKSHPEKLESLPTDQLLTNQKQRLLSSQDLFSCTKGLCFCILSFHEKIRCASGEGCLHTLLCFMGRTRR